MAKPELAECDRVLFVEGKGDLYFYAELLEALGKHLGVFIMDMNGKSELAANLETFIPPFLTTKQAIGVIVDADDNPLGASTQFAQLLAKLTGQPVVAGKWTDGKPRVGLFVTPDGSSAGEIETLVWRAWSADPANEKPKECIHEFVACMSNAGFTARSPDKGLVNALLAIRNDDDPRLGPGARAKVFDFARPEFSPLMQFLAKL